MRATSGLVFWTKEHTHILFHLRINCTQRSEKTMQKQHGVVVFQILLLRKLTNVFNLSGSCFVLHSPCAFSVIYQSTMNTQILSQATSGSQSSKHLKTRHKHTILKQLRQEKEPAGQGIDGVKWFMIAKVPCKILTRQHINLFICIHPRCHTILRQDAMDRLEHHHFCFFSCCCHGWSCWHLLDSCSARSLKSLSEYCLWCSHQMQSAMHAVRL